MDIREMGGVGDGKFLNTAIIQKAIDECHRKGGGKVIISGGIYKTGTVILKSNVELHLTTDAVLLGSEDCNDYPEREVSHVDTDFLPRFRNACLIFAEESENISVTGKGKIDCNGEHFVEKIKEEHRGWDYRRISAPTPPRAVFFAGCKNVTIEELTVVNLPAGWCFWIHDCDFVHFDRVKVLANVNYPNNDGIHINCSRNVTISNCSLTCGDDCIIVRANSASLKENKVCEKVVVNNCTLTSYSAGIRIGWLNDGVIRNCTFSNIVMTDTTVGIGIFIPFIPFDRNNPATSDQGREATHIENLSFSNIVMDKIARFPIKLDLTPDEGAKFSAIRNLYFSDIHATATEFPLVQGREGAPIQNVQFQNSTFKVTNGSEFEDLEHHGADAHPKGVFYPMIMRHVEGLHFSNVRFDVER